MGTKIKSFIAAMSLIGSLCIVSGCAEIEPVSKDQVVEPDGLLETRAIGTGSATIRLSRGAVLSAAAADYFSTIVDSWPKYAFTSVSMAHSIPAPPSGVTFNGWSVTPSGYGLSNGTSLTSSIHFNNPGEYMVAATFLSGSATISVSDTIQVLARPVITGPEFVERITNAAYSISNPQIAGQNVPRGPWTVTGGYASFFPSAGPSTYDVTIQFTGGPAIHTISVSFTLPGNEPYEVKKTVAAYAPITIDGPGSVRQYAAALFDVDTSVLPTGMNFDHWDGNTKNSPIYLPMPIFFYNIGPSFSVTANFNKYDSNALFPVSTTVSVLSPLSSFTIEGYKFASGSNLPRGNPVTLFVSNIPVDPNDFTFEWQVNGTVIPPGNHYSGSMMAIYTPNSGGTYTVQCTATRYYPPTTYTSNRITFTCN